MPRFLPQYKELDIRPKWENIAMVTSIVILFLLAPTMVLGYYSETSLPGQPLYPMKRGIESMVLLVESFTPYNKSLYYKTLATKRVNEAVIVVADAAANGDFSSTTGDIALNDVVVTVQQAIAQTNSIKDPVQKQQAQQQLTEAIHNYQTQLTQVNYSIESHLITPTPTPTGTTTTSNNQPTPTPTPNLQDQITQTQNDLQNLAQDLQATPSSTMPTPTPTNTPTPTPRHDQRDRNNSENR